MHRTQAKILLLIFALGAVFAVGLFFELREQSELERRMLDERRQEKAELVSEIITQKSEALEAFAKDYSRWDDMVEFATHRPVDLQFARENFDVAAPNYGVQAILVYTRQFDLVYAVDGAQSSLKETDLFGRVCRQYLPARPFRHFFMKGEQGVYELYTAPIQPTSDADRITPAQGYYVVAYLWNDSMLHWLSERTGTSTVLAGIEDPFNRNTRASSGGNNDVVARHRLCAAEGSPIAVLESRYESSVFAEHMALVRRQVLGLAIFGALVIVALSVALYGWVTRPLKCIRAGLNEESNKPLLPLVTQENEFGQIARMMSSFFDQKLALVEEIVERRQAECNAHESQRALRSFIANLAGIAYRCNYDDNRTAVSISEGCQELTGYPSACFTVDNPTVSLCSLIHPDDRNTVMAAIEEAVVQRLPYRLQYRIITAGDHERYVLDHGRCVAGRPGVPIALEGIILDITDRVQAENERAALQTKLNRAERVQALGLFAGGVAHDLNNMLAPVLAYPELILMKLSPSDPLRPKVAIIRDAAQQAVDVVQDMLTMARRGRYEMASVDLNEVVEKYLHSANFLQLQEKRTDVKVCVKLARGIATILGSSTHLYKATMNMVVNAYDAMPKGGTLTIRTEQRHLRALSDGHQIIPGEYVLIAVRDTGIGIAPEDMKKIFEPYFSRKKIGTSGTGLGLAVVYGTVKDHHGYYDIESSVGNGTEFILYFPAGRQESPGQEQGNEQGVLNAPVVT